MCVYLTYGLTDSLYKTNKLIKNTHAALQSETLYIIYTSLNFQMI